MNRTAGTGMLTVSRRGGAAKGCLIVLGIVVVLLIACGVYVALNARGWVASGMQTTLEAAIEDSDLSNAEKREVIDEISSVTSAFRAGDVTLEELGKIVEELVESPLLGAVVVYGTSHEYITPSGLSDEEKAASKVTLSRLTRGVIEETIPIEELEGVLEPLRADASTQGAEYTINFGDGRRIVLKPPSQVEDDDLRAMLVNADTLAEEKGIPSEAYEVDASEEIAAAIERALGRELPPAPEPGEGP